MSRRISLLNNKKYSYEYFCQEQVCRLCWNKSDVTKSIENDPKISEKILVCIGIDVSSGIPKTVCSNCLAKIDSFIEFKNYCTATDTKLRAILTSSLQHTEYEVKLENLPVPIDSDTQLPVKKEIVQQPLQQGQTIKLEKQSSESDDSEHDNFPLKDEKYCDICDIKFDSVNKKTNHIKDVHRTKQYECSACKKKFGNYACKLSHEKFNCNKTKYKCDDCGMFFQQRRLLERHMNKHVKKGKKLSVKQENKHQVVEANRYQCEICTESFDTFKNLKNHMTSHKESSEFICDTCGKIFSSKYTLQAHRYIHTNPKQLKCPNCDYCATNSSSLIVHIRIHTGARPYACEQCPSTFTTSSNLSKHRKLHLGIKNFKCQICNKEYMYKRSLQEHIISNHEGKKENMCKRCGALYFRFEHLRKHLLVKHRKVVKKLKGDYVEVNDAEDKE